MYERALSNQMFNDFKSKEGKLHRLLMRILKDDTLSLEFRGNGEKEGEIRSSEGANVYYRGGSLFYVEKKFDDYILRFNTNYCNGNEMSLSATVSVDEAIEQIPFYKQAMDFWFKNTKHNYEREFQQNVVRENNGLGDISHKTDYYITDVEYFYEKSRFDMIAVKWLSKGHIRKNMNAPSISVIEMKYGDDSLKDEAGIEAHLKDFKSFVESADLKLFCKDQSNIFRQKCELGLIPDMQNMPYKINIQSEETEMIFLLANHDPDSTVLKNVVSSINSNDYPFTIKFSIASMMGYGLYNDNMLTLEKFKLYLNK